MLLHLLILWLFTAKFDELKFLPPPKKQEKKISLNLKQIVTPPPAPKPIISPPVVKPVIKKKVEPVVEVPEVKRTILDEKKRTFATKSAKENNVTKVVKKPVKKIVKKHPKGISSQAQGKEVKKPKKTIDKKVVKKKVIQKKRIVKNKPVKRRVKRSKDPLANLLMGSGTSMHPKSARRSSSAGAYGERMIKKLYGSEFDTFSPTQKKYIRNNLSTIHQITQRTLSRNGYPTVAIQTRQQGTNVVSFYLHPNGDITGLKLKRAIGYESLDSNTLKVIRLAYKDYPLPNQKTKITFYVQYSMY
ncbi:MAG: energy transducer TonB [Epsilonproteobacteria bacterium]|nr:energy transducer TonB [Campylobacterota bacterium]